MNFIINIGLTPNLKTKYHCPKCVWPSITSFW